MKLIDKGIFLKKLSLISCLFLFLMLSNNLLAIGKNIHTFNLVNLTITEFDFVYKEVYGSVEDDFAKDLQEVNNYVLLFGAKSNLKAVMFLDYGVDKTNIPRGEKNIVPKQGAILPYLVSRYGESTLKTYRRALVGYLVSPQYFVTPSAPILIHKFKNVRVKAYQSLDKESKLSETVEEDEQDQYTQPKKLYDRVVMLDTVSLLSPDSKTYIGMLETYDVALKVSTFMAVPGNQESFLLDNDLDIYNKPGKFSLRESVVIKDDIDDAPSTEGSAVSNSITSAPEDSVVSSNTTSTTQQ